MLAWLLWFIGTVLLYRVGTGTHPPVQGERWAILIACFFWPALVVIAVSMDVWAWLMESLE